MVGIEAAVIRKCRSRPGSLQTEGPDEDSFTLAASAAERLLARVTLPPPVGGIHVAGTMAPEGLGGLPELLGVADVALRAHGPGPAGLASALTAAGTGGAGLPGLVVAVDPSSPDSEERRAHGAGAVAILVTAHGGLEVLGHRGRRHPTHRTPDASAWADAAVGSIAAAPEDAPGALQLVTEAPPPVLLNVWGRRRATMPAEISPSAPEGLGSAPTLPSALALLRLAERLRDGEYGVVATIHGEESWFLGVRRSGALRSESVEAGPAGLPPSRGEESPSLVSEGAYVPEPRYRENLPARWRFEAETCAACGAVTFPARGFCRSCRTLEGLRSTALPRSGTVVASTVVAPGAQPSEFDPMVAAVGAYGVALVELAPGIRVTIQVADGGRDPLPLGSSVTTELRRLYRTEGRWRYGRKAIPVSVAGPGGG